MSSLYDTFRGRLRTAITEDGRSCAKLADRSGYSAYYLRSVLRGQKSNPTLLFVEVMADTLHVSKAWLLGMSETKQDSADT